VAFFVCCYITISFLIKQKKGERFKSFALFISNNQTMVFYNLDSKPSFVVPGIAFGISKIDGIKAYFTVLTFSVFNDFHNGLC